MSQIPSIPAGLKRSWPSRVAKKGHMKIGGLQKVSLIDYPGKISAIIFTQSCNFRCPYCHNPELVEQKLYQPCLPEKDILEFLTTRRNKLDAVTLTGGEPTLQEDLIPFIQKIRKMGFAVKLDSNGSQPDVLASMIQKKLLDFIALDVKAPIEKYQSVVQAPVAIDVIRESIRLVIKAKIQHEFRTTVVASLLTAQDILAIVREIAGAKRYALQKFQPARTLNKKYIQEKTYSDEEFLKIKKQLEKNVPLIIIR
ncbi:MAG: anaerobic ribonucleoside-triphosphate reductase activating protein [Smithellaceae bacterium]|nr:anaerobic ribonucleoside-triphosphate reductase activating protein [Smithellaceae bacterium]